MLNVFEQPWSLLTAAVVVLLILLMARRVFPHKKYWWQWFLPAFFTVAAFGLDLLVQTDLERINAVINTGVKAVEEENPDAIEAIISDNYSDSYHRTKRSLTRHCRVRFSQPLVEKNIKRIMAIEISGPRATAIFTVRIVFDKRSYVYQSFKRIMLTKWKLDLLKEQNKGWLISRAELLEIDGQPAKWQNIR